MIKKFLQKIFKIVSYTFFESIHGKIKDSITSNQSNSIEVKSINFDKDLNYKVYKIINGRLYTDRIHDTAVIIENKIIEEPSFQWRFTKDPKLYNSNVKNNIVFTKGTPRKLKDLNGVVLSLLTGGGANKNYWHWIFDVLPRIGLCEKTFGLNNVDYFLLPDHVKKFQIETLDCLKISNEKKRLSSEKFRHIKAKELIVTDHPVVTSGDATKDIMDSPKWISDWLKSNFINEDVKNSKINGKKIYIDRSDIVSDPFSQRIIINEDEVKAFLLKNNFISIKLHEMKFIDQVKLFYNVNTIVGLHGGGFANLVFCKPGTKIIELRSSQAGPPIENLAKKNSLNYNSITVNAEQKNKLSYPNQHGAIHIPISILEKKIRN